MNLFIMLLGALGLSHSLFGERLLPIGTLYDPFIQRGLDALNYACYQDARFMLVATPSGVTLAPEGGAHQSIATPLIGMAQDGLAPSSRPSSTSSPSSCAGPSTTCSATARASRDAHLAARRDRRLGLSAAFDPHHRTAESAHDRRAWREDIIDGAYWLRKPGPECRGGDRLYQGAVAPEAIEAAGLMARIGAMSACSPSPRPTGSTPAGRRRSAPRAKGNPGPSHVERLLDLPPIAARHRDRRPSGDARLARRVRGHRTRSLGVEHFGQTGTIADLYRHYGIDAAGISNPDLP
jgi:pyruvate dehydrogenase E1 component